MSFIVVYFVVFGAGTVYILRLMSQPPHPGEEGPEVGPQAGARRRHHAGTRRRSGPHHRPCRRGGDVMTHRHFLDLPTLWASILAFAVFAYVVMDGFDLGIGILFPFFKPGRERDSAMNCVAPVWDGNETWLVLGGGGLMAAFPLAYAIILPALYAPIIAMLLALVFRGVAFEFRWRDPAHRRFWDFAFTCRLLVATLAQGITLGALLQGITVEGRAYGGGWWDWLTPFSLLVGVSLVIGYALLGATWLIMKTEGIGAGSLLPPRREIRARASSSASGW